MRFTATNIDGVMLIEPERLWDERGYFARTYSEREFAEQGLDSRFVQSSVSFNAAAGTVRGLHYQAPPHAESKLVRCSRGVIFDVAVDLRVDSPTHGRWTSAELSAENGLMLYIPEGCAHGFQTLQRDTEVSYQISRSYHPPSARGIRWDDPDLAIDWPPADTRIISERDRTNPLFREEVSRS